MLTEFLEMLHHFCNEPDAMHEFLDTVAEPFVI